MTIRETLIAARAKIADEKNWTQGDYFSDGRCCMIGALASVLGFDEDFWGGERAYRSKEAGSLFRACEGNPVHFNDTHDHAAVIAVFDRAIEESPQ